MMPLRVTAAVDPLKGRSQGPTVQSAELRFTDPGGLRACALALNVAVI